MRLVSRVHGSVLRPMRLRFARGRANVPGPVTFPATDLKVTVRIALGADLSQPWYTWSWLDITGRVRYRDVITITAGRRDWASRTDTSTARLRIDNSDGYFSRRNPRSPYFGLLTRQTPIWVTVDPGSGESTRYQGYVTEWPTRWTDKSGVDSTVPVVCAGVIRRLEKFRTRRSALARAIPDSSPTAYWSLERSAASGLTSGAAMTQLGQIQWSVNAGCAGSDALPDYTGGGKLIAPLPNGTVSENWRLECVARFGTGSDSVDAADFTTAVTLTSPLGTVNTFELLISGGTAIFQWTDTATSFTGLIDSGVAVDDGEFHHFRMTAAQNGANIDVGFTVDGVSTGTDSIVAKTLNSAGSFIAVNALQESFPYIGSVGHVTYWAPYAPSTAIDTALVARGWAGEQAHARLARVFGDEVVAFFTAAGESVAMGPQQVGTALEVARDCATADQGLLYEKDFGLAYQALSERYNAPVALDLDFNQRHVAEEPEPADDDQRTINRWTSSRTDGSSATVEHEDLTDADPLYDGAGTVNIQADDQLADDAGWRVHLGTVDEDRWPRIAIRLHGTPDLIPQWVAVTPGARLNLANPPDQVAPDTIAAVIEGHTERFDTKTWDVTLNTSPASPYDVGVLAADSGDTDPLLGWLSADTCTLNAGFAAGSTSWLVDSDPLWTTDADDFPVQVRIAGEVFRVDSVTGASNPQTWAGAGAINGVSKGHAAGEAIDLVHPVVLTL